MPCRCVKVGSLGSPKTALPEIVALMFPNSSLTPYWLFPVMMLLLIVSPLLLVPTLGERHRCRSWCR